MLDVAVEAQPFFTEDSRVGIIFHESRHIQAFLKRVLDRETNGNVFLAQTLRPANGSAAFVNNPWDTDTNADNFGLVQFRFFNDLGGKIYHLMNYGFRIFRKPFPFNLRDHVDLKVHQNADHIEHVETDSDDVTRFGIELHQNRFSAACGLVQLAFNYQPCFDVVADIVGNGDDI